ncbi:MAG: hypothetical protein KDI32_04855 [Pseudomonadales bacterium]|nr:hypothetical protein [Pseudomonadales bacterium]
MSGDDLPAEAAHDLEFEAYVRRRRALFPRDADEDSLEPPPEVDRAVLARARAAIHAEAPTRLYQGARWALPIALAATVVLAFTVFLNIGLPGRHQIDVPNTEEGTAQNAARRITPQPPADSAATVGVAGPAAVADAARPSAARTIPPAPVIAAADDAAARRDERPTDASVGYAAPPPASAVAGRSRRLESESSQSRAKSQDYSVEESITESEPRAAPSQAMTTSAAPLAQAKGALDATAAPSRAPGESARPAPPLSADAWWARIQTLRQNGSIRVADRELEHFRAAYPDDPRLEPAAATTSTP